MLCIEKVTTRGSMWMVVCDRSCSNDQVYRCNCELNITQDRY